MLLGSWAPPPARAPDEGCVGAGDASGGDEDGGGSSHGGSAAAGAGRRPLRVLDAGTGTGVLALMMAQKSEAGTRVDAIDTDDGATAQAARNAAASVWAAAVRVVHTSLQDWAAAAAAGGCSPDYYGCGRYDVIISNPPYFRRSSKPEACSRRAAARHADVGLPFEDLAACAAALLRPGGALCLVLPPPEAVELLEAAAAAGLRLEDVLRVYSREGDARPKRVLMRLERPGAGAKRGGGSSSSGGADGNGSGDGGGGGIQELCQLLESGTGAAAGGGAGERRRELLRLLEASGGRLDIRWASEGDDLAAAAAAAASAPPAAAAAAFTKAYIRLTADYHHPDFFRP